jgi:hypothetical protein
VSAARSAWRRVVAGVLALAVGVAFCLSAARADIVFRGGGGAGTFTGGTVTGATVFTNTVTFGPAAGAADSVMAGETTGCITFEGTTADANETRLCAANALSDLVVSLPNVGGTVAIINAAGTWTGVQTFQNGAYFYTNVEAVTTTKTPNANEGNETYTNTGDTDGATFQLPDNPPVGISYNVAITTNQTLTILPGTGETIYMGTNVCATSIATNQVGATVTLRAVVGGSGGIWMAFGATPSTSSWVCV